MTAPFPDERRHRVAIGLGSNLGDRRENLRRALDALAQLGSGLQRSSLYETPPVGPPQPTYLNAVALLDTTLAPRALLARLLDAEREAGRVRRERWGPRLLDLDLLTYGALQLAEPGLVVPHPELSRRAFVLVPLVELDPAHVVPGLGPAASLLAALPASERASIVRVAAPA